jgi:hypothetical protein
MSAREIVAKLTEDFARAEREEFWANAIQLKPKPKYRRGKFHKQIG